MIVKDIKDLLISDSIASKSAKDSEIKSFFGFERLVEDCERSLRGLCRHKDTVDQYMQNLRKFKNTFEEKILSRNQAEDAGNYFKRGQRCVNKFE